MLLTIVASAQSGKIKKTPTWRADPTKSQQPTLTDTRAGTSSAETYYNLGWNFFDNKDYDMAIKNFIIAAEKGHVKAQWRAGLMYYLNDWIPQNLQESYKWLRKAAVNNHALAQYLLGYMYMNGEYVKTDVNVAKILHIRASSALYNQVLDYIKSNAELAISNLEYIIEMGLEPYCSSAYLQLGRIYFDALGGVSKDSEKAFLYFMEASDRGNNIASCFTAYCYEWGIGVARDKKKAKRYYKTSGFDYLSQARNKLDERYQINTSTLRIPYPTINH